MNIAVSNSQAGGKAHAWLCAAAPGTRLPARSATSLMRARGAAIRGAAARGAAGAVRMPSSDVAYAFALRTTYQQFPTMTRIAADGGGKGPHPAWDPV